MIMMHVATAGDTADWHLEAMTTLASRSAASCSDSAVDAVGSPPPAVYAKTTGHVRRIVLCDELNNLDPAEKEAPVRFLIGLVAISCTIFLGTPPADARGKGPGVVFTCEGGQVTKASTIMVTNGPPKGSGFVETLQPGATAAQVCDAINASANLLGGFKTETEGTTVVVVYGADVRLNHVPDGIKLKIEKF